MGAFLVHKTKWKQNLRREKENILCVELMD
nr:MAG TPA: Testis highly expressed protein 4 [Bacteriophage sp.]